MVRHYITDMIIVITFGIWEITTIEKQAMKLIPEIEGF